MIYFNLPGLYEHFPLNSFILQYKQLCPQAFYDNVEIGSVFGNFQYCIWDGGRNFLHYDQATKETVEDVSKLYEGYNIPMRFIFTNPVIKKEHLNNRFCNMVLEVCNNGKNEICLNSPLMEEYIRKNYPNYKIISSTTKRLNTKEGLLEELNKDYFQVCLDYDLNKNTEVLNAIPKNLRYKCEFLVNAICPSNCPSRKGHYATTGQANLTYLKDKYTLKCNISRDITHPDTLGCGNNFTMEEIYKYYNDYGFNHFKLEGRTIQTPKILTLYLYYLIKPEWRPHCISAISEIDSGEGILFNDKNSSQIFTYAMERPMYSAGH